MCSGIGISDIFSSFSTIVAPMVLFSWLTPAPLVVRTPGIERRCLPDPTLWFPPVIPAEGGAVLLWLSSTRAHSKFGNRWDLGGRNIGWSGGLEIQFPCTCQLPAAVYTNSLHLFCLLSPTPIGGGFVRNKAYQLFVNDVDRPIG